MEYSKLRGRIVEKYGTMSNFAEKIGSSRQTVSHKLTGKNDFSREDIQNYADVLEIPKEQIGLFFFE